MPRERLAIGTHGAISTAHHPSKQTGDRWEAYCTYRDHDGRNRKITRWGPTKPKAVARLQQAIRDRPPRYGDETLTAQSTVADAAARWWLRIEAHRSPNTIRSYRNILDAQVLPGLGELRLFEVNAGRLDEFMDALAARKLSAEYRRSVRTVISGVLQTAVRAKAIPTNYTREMSRIEGGTKTAPRALTPEERAGVLERLDDLRCGYHRTATAEKAQGCEMCAGKRGDLAPLVRFMLGTGCRIGEALAVRWCDLDLEGTTVDVGDGVVVPVRTVALGPTIVRVAGRGLVRQESGKTASALRTVPLPEFLVTMLAVRRPADAVDADPVFPSRALTWRDPNAAARMLREARDQLGLGWRLTSHTFRKTAITILDGEKLTARQIADLVGHRKPSMTMDVYMGRGQVSPAAALALDAAFRGDARA